MTDADELTGLARSAVIRMALALVALVALIVFAQQQDSPATEGPGELRFSLECHEADGAGGTVACALVVSGLPAPLESKVVVPLASTRQPSSGPTGFVPADTVVADEAPHVVPGVSLVVMRHLPASPPSRPPTVLQVPEPPPKTV